ncbi:hypothetical protein GCM10010261_63950 [Streptomyces pilosus]|uniref:hypothetical protein n=1 Tax=Streptomyces pilosus TaxID=28893 RepID=UPI001674B975|nr:hypothetical protein [Streptomyces pilosus]GGV69388.1 hypothetical protein GCM10010261_63950 [Streptomyces pilosus]
MVIAPDIEGRPTNYAADTTWFDETLPVKLGHPAPGTFGSTTTTSPTTGTSADPDVTTVHGAPPADPHGQLATLRRKLPARVELVEGSYQQAADSAHTLMTDSEEAHRLPVQLGEDALPAEQHIERMEKLTKVRATAQASVTTLEPVEALILQVRPARQNPNPS